MDNQDLSTRLEIGLTREDQDRIQQIRGLKNPKKMTVGRFMEKLNDFSSRFSRVGIKDKVTFFQLLSVMLNSGVTLVRALYVLSDQLPNPRIKVVIRGMAQRMEEGISFSEAMQEYSAIFTDSERGMVASGEASGKLDSVLKDMAAQAEKSVAIRIKVRGAMIYPAVVFSVMILAVVIILTLVVPKLTTLFTESGNELPASTRFLMASSDFVQNQWGLLATAVVLLVLVFMFLNRNRQGRLFLHGLMLRVPFFGTLIKKYNIAQFTRVLASLLDAGLPIVKALEINSNALTNEVYKRRIFYASQDVAQGIPLGENLTDDSTLFPPMVASMMLVGEQTANVSQVCRKIADFYETELDSTVNNLSRIMEPMILVLMGGVVGFVVMAIMQPILSLSDLASSI